ncbi:hypothetical protein BXY80_2019 [Ichthyenterobacterium magnum]|uniref:Uncharacterized protein n=2 Tax=Ichthyenterobacterium magnum TaxID=1230530 RepID=A0A420DLD0_9FLAO|nr:hypothetical protein BXY80_2019 [Ichthyenterobacterium magnum]
MIKHAYLVVLLFMSTLSFSQKNIFDVARSGTIDELKALMSINADTINVVDANGFSPLTLACYKGSDELAVFLASKVKDIDGNSKYGTPLMAAVYKNREAVVKALLDFKADPNKVDANGKIPLHYAVFNRNEALIKLLVDAGANPTLKDKRGDSALDYAKMTQNEAILKLINNK